MAEYANTPAWLKARKRGIGGSDAAALFGASPWQTPFSLYVEKVTELDAAEAADDERDVSSPKYWGHMFEPVVRQAYADRTGRTVVDGCVLKPHRELAFVIANTDGRILRPEEWATDGVFEGKMTTLFKREEWDDHAIPLYYQIQLQHYMAVEEVDWGAVACLVLGLPDPLVYRETPRNDGFIDALLEREHDFWTKHVVPRVPPPVDGSESATKAVKKLFRKANGRTIFLPLEAKDWADELAEIAAAKKRLEDRESEIKNAIRFIIGDASYGIATGPDGEPIVGFSHANVVKAPYMVKASEYRMLRTMGQKKMKEVLAAEDAAAAEVISGIV
jgi:putative phage-type endonuclease